MHGWVIRTTAHVKPCERKQKRCIAFKSNANGERRHSQYRAKQLFI